jgi:hypothetical protein
MEEALSGWSWPWGGVARALNPHPNQQNKNKTWGERWPRPLPSPSAHSGQHSDTKATTAPAAGPPPMNIKFHVRRRNSGLKAGVRDAVRTSACMVGSR